MFLCNDIGKVQLWCKSNIEFMIRLLQNVLVGVVYVVLSLLIGEQHPFTLVPMYSNLPNYAYSFYLSDDKGQILPFAKYFKCADDYPAHTYNAICEDKKISYGNGLETEEQLAEIGKQMIAELKEHQYALLPKGQVQLHRINYFMENDSLKEVDSKMYEEPNY